MNKLLAFSSFIAVFVLVFAFAPVNDVELTQISQLSLVEEVENPLTLAMSVGLKGDDKTGYEYGYGYDYENGEYGYIYCDEDIPYGYADSPLANLFGSELASLPQPVIRVN